MAKSLGFMKPSDLADGVFQGKGISALLNSRATRDELIQLFGGVEHLPSSVMKARRTRTDKERDEHGAERSYSNSNPATLKRLKEKKLGAAADKAFNISGRGSLAGALSTFPQDIGRSMLLLYSDPGDLVVDPFAGHNSRMSLCVENGRHYYGQDLSTPFMEFNRKKAQELRELYPSARIKVKHGDSRRLQFKDAVGDFTITSPPYYDIEQYGDEPEQMAKCKTYKDFIRSMQQVMDENYRVLKTGAFACWFLNDFRRKGVFHSYHSDMIRAGRRSGFTHHDLMIVWYGRGFRDVFISQTVKQRIIPKSHEFCLVFKKEEQ